MNNKLFDVYRELYENNVLMFSHSFANTGLKCATIELNDCYGLFLDTEKISTSAEETVIAAHECGHIVTGSTHKVSSPLDLISKHEHRANVWAIRKLIPREELYSCYHRGITVSWELADEFGVTESFAKMAMEYYHEQEAG